jgi:hypothetical protein
MVSAQPAIIPPSKPKLVGWLAVFIARFYVGAMVAFAGASENHSKAYIIVGVVELALGILLSLRNRTGLMLAKIWLMLEAAGFGLLAALAFLPPVDSDTGLKLLSYSAISMIIAVYFLRSRRVKVTYSRS